MHVGLLIENRMGGRFPTAAHKEDSMKIKITIIERVGRRQSPAENIPRSESRAEFIVAR